MVFGVWGVGGVTWLKLCGRLTVGQPVGVTCQPDGCARSPSIMEVKAKLVKMSLYEGVKTSLGVQRGSKLVFNGTGMWGGGVRTNYEVNVIYCTEDSLLLRHDWSVLGMLNELILTLNSRGHWCTLERSREQIYYISVRGLSL